MRDECGIYQEAERQSWVLYSGAAASDAWLSVPVLVKRRSYSDTTFGFPKDSHFEGLSDSGRVAENQTLVHDREGLDKLRQSHFTSKTELDAWLRAVGGEVHESSWGRRNETSTDLPANPSGQLSARSSYASKPYPNQVSSSKSGSSTSQDSSPNPKASPKTPPSWTLWLQYIDTC